MEQVNVTDIVAQGERLGLRCVAGSPEGVEVSGVEIVAMDDLTSASPDRLVIVAMPDGAVPRPYQVDIAIRRAIARRCAGLVFVGDFPIAETARSLADRGGLPVLMSTATPSELAVLMDRTIRGDAEEALSRAEYAIARASALAAEAPGRPVEAILDEVGAALGVRLSLIEDPGVALSRPDAVCVGEVPVGRLTADRDDASVAVALPVIAALLSRTLQRELQARFGPVRSRADLIIELIFAESSRIDRLTVEATRAGLPVSLSHAVAWLTSTHRDDPERRPPAVLVSSVELHALQLVDRREEVWHLATFHDDIVMVASEETGAPDHQRRLRDVMESVVAHAGSVAGEEWAFTVGLGTPQSGAAGLRQSATEARLAAEAAVAGGRAGRIEVTDVTGLRRVLLDFYASPLSRSLLDDILTPLDALGPERAAIAIRTLVAYLGHRNSLTRAGEALNLHPNAVNYRIRRIEQTLGLDLTEPDVRFAVELACRVRLIASRR
ncbi:sugar diacid utilization regulator [Thermocatellispora tengchongensis]|uniref:Sugar diacid utilization regulator n=1 Tax=Thermocatellispora tengchongensis TaxID=1073253 RepID=A0A840PDW4_9ACTN|nr:helix-turn-helix domain-containing protein [Thermocatellispora tengchongensis]MBB5136926.1 sugar diacid utilization regulator [Thermocatellispora tengchongensis]